MLISRGAHQNDFSVDELCPILRAEDTGIFHAVVFVNRKALLCDFDVHIASIRCDQFITLPCWQFYCREFLSKSTPCGPGYRKNVRNVATMAVAKSQENWK